MGGTAYERKQSGGIKRIEHGDYDCGNGGIQYVIYSYGFCDNREEIQAAGA